MLGCMCHGVAAYIAKRHDWMHCIFTSPVGGHNGAQASRSFMLPAGQQRCKMLLVMQCQTRNERPVIIPAYFGLTMLPAGVYIGFIARRCHSYYGTKESVLVVLRESLVLSYCRPFGSFYPLL